MATERIALTFEGGLNESQEASQLPIGNAPVLENWIPEITGGLRCRRGWSNFGTTGAPTTRKARGLGFYSRNSNDTTPARVQAATPATGTSTAPAVAWPGATIANNLLIAVVSWGDQTKTVTAPAGWTSTTAVTSDGGVQLFYIANAASRSGTETFTLSGSCPWVISLFEYSGIATATPLDQQASTTGTGTAPDSGTTSTTTQAVELWFAAISQGEGGATFTDPTNGFSIISQAG